MNNKNIFVVVVIAILAIAGVYAFTQYQSDNNVSVSLNNSQASDNLDYTNSDYGFKLKLGPEWDGYRVFKLGNNNVSSYDFCVKTTDTNYVSSNPDQAGYACPMSVFAINEQAWNQMADLERNSFGEPQTSKDGVRFFVSTWQNPAQDLANKNFNIDSVRTSLSF